MRFKVAFIVLVASFALVAGGPGSDDSEQSPSVFPWPWKTTTTTTTPPTTPSTPPTTPSTPPTTPSTPPTTPSTPPTTPSTPPTTPSTPPTTPSTPPTTPSTPPTTPSPPPTTPSPPPTTPSTPSTIPPSIPTTTSKPTPAPTPAPKLDRGNWTVSEDNVTCIYLQATLTANVQYPLISKGVGHKSVNIPNNATGSGHCGNTSQVLAFSWDNNKAVFLFNKVANSSEYGLATVNVSLAANNKTFPNISKEASSLEFVSSGPVFLTSLSFSYQCTAQKNVPLLDGKAPNGSRVLGSLEFNKLHLQAFSESRVARFGAPEDCDEDASDMVPIVVGCALAALVVIILAVYVWGRRRSQNRGYLSM